MERPTVRPKRQQALGRPAPPPAHSTVTSVTGGTHFAFVCQSGLLHAGRPKEGAHGCAFLDVSHTQSEPSLYHTVQRVRSLVHSGRSTERPLLGQPRFPSSVGSAFGHFPKRGRRLGGGGNAPPPGELGRPSVTPPKLHSHHPVALAGDTLVGTVRWAGVEQRWHGGLRCGERQDGQDCQQDQRPRCRHTCS